MRLVTSCPACNTLFHVRQEQLSPAQTEVRCGLCREVFNVRPRLYTLLEPQSLLPELKPDYVYPEVKIPPISYDSAPPKDTDYDLEAHSHYHEPAAVEDKALADTPPDEEAPAEEAPAEEAPAEEVPAEEVPAEEIQAEETLTPAPDEPAPTADTQHITAIASTIPHQRTETLEVLLQPPRVQPEPHAVETSFLDDRERLRTPLLPRWLGILLAVLLSLGALAQSSYIFRTELASHWPASKPWLVSACTWLGCTVPLARNAELLALDDSDLQENLEHPEVIQLSTTLINNASYTQAYPLLELTLTDDDDQPKLRRIFTPKEYLRAESDIEAGLPANEEIQIKLSLSTSDVAVSGYRVFVTY